MFLYSYFIIVIIIIIIISNKVFRISNIVFIKATLLYTKIKDNNLKIFNYQLKRL